MLLERLPLGLAQRKSELEVDIVLVVALRLALLLAPYLAPVLVQVLALVLALDLLVLHHSVRLESKRSPGYYH